MDKNIILEKLMGHVPLTSVHVHQSLIARPNLIDLKKKPNEKIFCGKRVPSLEINELESQDCLFLESLKLIV